MSTSAELLLALKAELKSFEAEWRASHDSKDPTKADIKAIPEIAEKYKKYNKLKTGATTGGNKGKEKEKDKSGAAAAARVAPSTNTSTAFHTPTKLKSRPSKPAKESPPKPPTYVIANSPSKLRQLASLHSSRGSPNHPAPSTSTIDAEKGLIVVGSPKKYNPFASPSAATAKAANGGGSGALGGRPGSSPRKKNGGGGTFADQLMRSGGLEKKSLMKSTIGTGTGVGGKETEDIFGGRKIVRSGSAMSSSPAPVEAKRASTTNGKMNDRLMDLDQPPPPALPIAFLGPSPTKPSTKSFKPLFVDPSHSPSSSSTITTDYAKPKLFETTFESKVAKKLNDDESVVVEKKKVALATLVATRRRSSSPEGGSDEDEDRVGKNGAKGKAKGTRRGKQGEAKDSHAAKKAKLDPKLKNKGKDDAKTLNGHGNGNGHGTVKSKDGSFIVDLSDGEEGSNQILLHPPRRPSSKSNRESNEMDVEGGEDEFEEEEEEDESLGSLFYRSRDLLATAPSPSPSTSRQSSTPPRGAPATDLLATSSALDPNLLSILSLHPTSPQKRSVFLREKARDKKVQDLLSGPAVGKDGKVKKARKVTGLLDMVPSDEEEDGAGREIDGDRGGTGDGREVEAEDDDWASENEGWKDLGDGMMDGVDDGW